MHMRRSARPVRAGHQSNDLRHAKPHRQPVNHTEHCAKAAGNAPERRTVAGLTTSLTARGTDHTTACTGVSQCCMGTSGTGWWAGKHPTSYLLLRLAHENKGQGRPERQERRWVARAAARGVAAGQHQEAAKVLGSARARMTLQMKNKSRY